MSNQVPSRSIDAVIAHLEKGGSVCVVTRYKAIIISMKNWKAYQKVGLQLIKEEGEGYRVKSGKSSYYLFPGQLTFC